jgi:drug/metabolite transporter (DMT)-like permease
MQGAVEEVEPVPFIAARFAIGAAVLVPIAVVRRAPTTGVLQWGLTAGVALGAGYVLQTTGLQYTTSSVSAFLTYLLVVFVPLLSAAVLRRPPRRATLAGVALALLGLFLLTDGAGVGLGRGEVLTIGCALAFAVHILVLDRTAGVDIVALNAAQFAAVAAVLAVPGALATGGYDFPVEAWAAAAYTGVVVNGLAFGLQVWGQRRVSPSRTALVLMLEPVFAAGLGYVDGERVGAAGAIGAGLILAGILVSELPTKNSNSIDRTVNIESG